MAWKLLRHMRVTGTLTCVTGLRIGGSKEDLEIGGMDNPVIRDPVTHLPYVPGSSIKGKLRAMLEYAEGKVPPDTGRPHGCREAGCLVCTVFGPHMTTGHQHGPSRLIVRDAVLSEGSRQQLAKLREEGLDYTETKTEVWIDRRTGIAGQGGLRTQERVPAGTVFDFAMSVRVFEGDDGLAILPFIERGLGLMQDDAMGGSGTRGYGQIKLEYRIEGAE